MATVRPPGPEDFAAIVVMGEAFDRALTGTGDWSEEDVAHDWRELADPERDAWLVEEDGAVVGYATFQDDAEGCFQADGYVHPERFGRGIGSLIVELTERRAAEQLEIVTLPRVVMHNTVLHIDRAARDLLEGRGYRPIRHFLRMQIDMAEAPPAPVWPEGVSVAPFHPDADLVEVHACLQEAFAEGGEVCGVALSTAGQFDMGFVNALAVRPAWRRRGLGLALLRQAFTWFWERGERRVGLGVDTENTTDALRLYERAGMRSVWQADVHEKVLRGE